MPTSPSIWHSTKGVAVPRALLAKEILTRTNMLHNVGSPISHFCLYIPSPTINYTTVCVIRNFSLRAIVLLVFLRGLGRFIGSYNMLFYRSSSRVFF